MVKIIQVTILSTKTIALNLRESEKNQLIDLKPDYLARYIISLPVFGFKSGRIDLILIKSCSPFFHNLRNNNPLDKNYIVDMCNLLQVFISLYSKESNLKKGGLFKLYFLIVTHILLMLYVAIPYILLQMSNS